jgi:hypothetical protein
VSLDIDWEALVRVVSVGLVVGAGLPALYAVGVRALAGPGSHSTGGKRRRGRIATAVACFAVVTSAAISAIILLSSGGS